MGASRIRWLRASFGPKADKGAALDLLVDCEDLPGDGWRKVDQRTWRTGEGGFNGDWARRARDLGSITGWRSFHSKPTGRWAWVQVVPLASRDDALDALAVMPGAMLANLRFEGEVRETFDGEGPPVTGASATWSSRSVIGLDGVATDNAILAAVFDTWLVVANLSAPASPHNWDVVHEVIALQSARLVRTLT
ncbi:MAG TPA: hypothetical protein PKA24_14060 [Microthrixaceae bacterium]|jgi:hypothetical protein|nr:hypothetical protein [Microthrixaceae bacterium]HMT61984.1 hypothetical protein [Microthrixaceae bacterium]